MNNALRTLSPTALLAVVSSGPGLPEHLTAAARQAICTADILVGYGPYLRQLGELTNGKQVLSSGMRQKIDRCRAAIAVARQGARVALISGGDASIYGMAGLVFELLAAEGDDDLPVSVIPGISAFQAAASRLGAPLMHDTALISLSDLLTPWETIRKRLQAAAETDFVIALYNPKSTKRIRQLDEARQIILDSRPGRSVQPGARALMVVGTASDVGKSAITAGICRLLTRRGLRVAPFKSQNMALNAAVTPEGGEIGRAQASQAAACRIAPHTDMNPILLKPTTEVGSQVIIQGTAVGTMSVADYDRYKPTAFAKVRESYHRLRQQADFIVIEGAGSIAEINLKERDIANLAVARMAGNAPAILVADIDRGGVFAQLVGSIELLEPWERALIKGIVINKFRGDASILEPGLRYVEQRCGIPVLGVLPWLKGLALPAEDSLALPAIDSGSRPSDRLNIGIVRLPRISNFTDFEPLQWEPDVNLCYLDRPEQLVGLDLIIIPGSKAVASDLAWLRETGLANALETAAAPVFGICGGYQMLGERIDDPLGMESRHDTIPGLGLLPVATELTAHKATRLVSATAAAGAHRLLPTWQLPIQGYEIHLGITRAIGPVEPLLMLTHRDQTTGSGDGAVSADGNVFGCYLHGLFDDAPLREALLNRLRSRKGLSLRIAAPPPCDPYDRLADLLEEHLDMAKLLALCGLC